VAEEECRPRATQEGPAGESRPAETGPAPGADEPRTILIVDDEKGLRKALERSLRQENRRTLAAASGEEALGLLREREIDLVITDLVMPGMDGMTLVRKIRSAFPGAKIIIITAYGSAESMQEAKDLGVACYLAKPFDLSHLKAKVDELLSTGAPSRRRGARGLWSAGCRTLGVVVGLSRKALRRIRPAKVLSALGRMPKAAAGLVSVFRKKDAKRK